MKNIIYIFVVALIIIGFLAYPVYDYLYSPRIISLSYVDLSESNRKFKDDIIIFCNARYQNLKDNDTQVDGKFADTTVPGDVFSFQDIPSKLRKDCKSIMDSSNVFKNKGTSLDIAFAQATDRLNKINNNSEFKKRIAMAFMVNAAEPVEGGKEEFNAERFYGEVNNFLELNKNAYILFLISDDDLKKKMSGISVDRVIVSDYNSIKKNVELLHSKARSSDF